MNRTLLGLLFLFGAFGASPSRAELIGHGDVFEIGYRGIEVHAGPVFEKGSDDPQWRHAEAPRPVPVHYQVAVAQYVMRYGKRTGRYLMRKELPLEQIDYEAIRRRPIGELVKYDASAKRIDFFFKANPSIPSLSFVIDDRELRSEANVAASDAEMGRRIWKSSAGTTVEARYLSRTADDIALEKSDGSRLIVPFAGFSATDQELLQRLSGRTSPPTPADIKRQQDVVKQLGERAATGDLSAIDELGEIAERAYQDMADDDGTRAVNNIELFQPPFQALGVAAGAGQEGAFKALVYANTKTWLKAFASQGLGRAAAKGSKPALEQLLNYQANGILYTAAAKALIIPAREQVPEAMRFLLDVMNRERGKMMMRMAAEGLEPAAKNGNAEARAAIEKYQAAHGPDPSISAN